jgi:putative membrane protein
LGLKRGCGFLLLAGLAGFIFESIGLSTTAVFGHYAYQMQTPSLYSVPWLVIIYWTVFVYIGYAISTSFLYWSGKAKPSINNRRKILLIGLILTDGIAVTAIDLFMDPLQVNLGSWSWAEGGAYFGVPLQNFLGWFLVTIIITSIFRLYEYYFPHRLAVISKTVFIIPLIAYIAILLAFIVLSIIFRMPSLAAVGSVLMVVIAAVNLFWYEKRMLLRHHKQE